LTHDEQLSKSIVASYWPRIYNAFRSEVKNDPTNEMPPIKPFENIYLKYWTYNK